MVDLFRGVEIGHRALDYHLERHNVLAGNVANVDTPGFRPLDLTRAEETSSAFSASLARTDAGHLRGGSAIDHGGFSVAEEQGIHAGNDENAVSLEHELAKLSANHIRYESAARLVQMQLGQLRYAANDGTGG
jgi:flagellar basal-body rod protein FlgB